MSAHRYWRVRPISLQSGTTPLFIGELEFRSSVGGADLTGIGNGGTAISSAVYTGNVPSYGPNNAFDNVANPYFGAATAVPNAWIGWDFGAGVTQDIIQVVMTNATGSNTNFSPLNSILEKSDDGTNWSAYSLMFGMPATSGASQTFNYSPPATATVFATMPMPLLSMLGGGSADLATPAALVAYGGASATLITPSAQISIATGAIASVTTPAATLFAVGSSSAGVNDFTYVASSASLVAYGGANTKLTAPAPALGITGTVTGFGAAALSAPAALLSATGTVSGKASAALTAPMAKLVGYFGAVASVSIAGKATLTATGTSGSIGYATLTAPLFDLTASATRQNSGSAVLVAPAGRLATTGAAWLIAPGAQLTAIGTAVVAVSYEAYALNLNHRNPDSPDELTRYTNYPFDRIVRYENSYFGMNATGLYLLEGTTDFAEPTPTKVPWRFKTGLTDFESPNLKTVNWAYFGGRMAPAATISIHYGDTGEQNYAYSTPRGAEAQNYRQPFGRGIKSRYYAVEAEGSGALSIDSMMFDIASMARKV